MKKYMTGFTYAGGEQKVYDQYVHKGTAEHQAKRCRGTVIPVKLVPVTEAEKSSPT